MSTPLNRSVSAPSFPSSPPVASPKESSPLTSPALEPKPISDLEQRKLSFSEQTSLKSSKEPIAIPDEKALFAQIDTISPAQMLENLNEMPEISAFTPLSKKGFKNELSQLVTAHLKGPEENLRSTWYKSSKTIQTELQRANQDARAALQKDPRSQELLQYCRSLPRREAKNILAQAISGMRAEKYGTGVNYSLLSKNKQALVDAVYNGLMGADLEPTGTLTVPEHKKGPVGKLGCGAILKKDLTVTTSGGTVYHMKAGEPVTVHERDGKTFIQPAKLKEKATNPKDFDAYEVSRSKVEIADPSILKIKTQTFTSRKEEPLFANPISVTDMQQGALGDCYLIAAIYAVARKNPDAIYNMMKDNGNGTVTVRFYGADPETQKYGEVFITVEKSVPNDDAHVDGALWVQMLEKAYATYKGSYDAIGRGGHSSEVFREFTGRSEKSTDILAGAPHLETFAKNLGTAIDSSQLQRLLKDKQQAWGLSDTQIEQICSLPVDQLQTLHIPVRTKWKWPEFTEKANAYAQLPKDTPPDVREQALTETTREKKKLEDLVNNVFALVDRDDRDQALCELLEAHPQYQLSSLRPEGLSKQGFVQVIADLREKARKEPETTVNGKTFPTAELVAELEVLGKDRFPDADFKGYTDKQTALFDQIGSLLTQGEYVAIGSKKEIGVSQGKGHSGGESVVDGLAGQHAYAVLDVFEQGGLKFVRVANPWGNDFSRDYDMRNGKLVAKTFDPKDHSHLPNTENKSGAGIGINESWIELRELSQVFGTLYHTRPD